MNRRAAEIKAREQKALNRIKQRKEELEEIKRNTNVNVIPMAHVEKNDDDDNAQIGKYINNTDDVNNYDINLTNVDNNRNNGISIENPQKFDYSYLRSLFTKKPVAQEIISHTGSYNLTELANASKVNTGGKSKKNKKNRKNKKTKKLNKKIKKTRKLNKRRK
jgi:hypothetical protein